MISKPTAKVALISTVAISALLFLLYLPVLIWSPPWGEDGYYEYGKPRHDLHKDYTYFKNGILRPMHIEKTGEVILYPESNFTHKNNSWQNNTLIHKSTVHFSISASLLTSTAIHQNGRTVFNSTASKIFNPFTLWHIKYLEWTN